MSKKSSKSKKGKGKGKGDSSKPADTSVKREPDKPKADKPEPKTDKTEADKPHDCAPPPPLATVVTRIDNFIGYGEQAFLVFALFSLIGIGTYQFISGHILKSPILWPFDAIRHLVFFTAMGGAALSAQKGRMISMDFIARKLGPKNRVLLRIAITAFVIFACYLLYKGGLHVQSAEPAHGEELSFLKRLILDRKTVLWILPTGACLIAWHYILHAIVDISYLAAGRIPPEEEGPAAH